MSKQERPPFDDQPVRAEIQALNGSKNVKDWELRLLQRINIIGSDRVRDVLTAASYPLLKKYIGSATNNFRATVENRQSLSQLTEKLFDLYPNAISYVFRLVAYQ